MTNKYTTAEDVSAKLNGVTINGSSTPSDDVVDSWIDEASNEIEERTGRIWSSTVSGSVLLDYDGSGYLRVPHTPVISISSLEYNKNSLGDTTDDWHTLTEGSNNNFIVYGDGEIKFFGSTQPSAGNQRIRINYTYGYTSTPLWIKKLCTSMVSRSFISSVVQGDAKEQGGAVTVGNISISDPSTFSGNFLQQLDTEIDNIFSKHINQTHIYRADRNYSNMVR